LRIKVGRLLSYQDNSTKNILTIIEAIIQGIIQGVTEFLPISSSGHLSVYQHFTGIGGEDSLLFTVVLHLGTLLAIFIMFSKTIWDIIKEFFRTIGDIFKGKNIVQDMNDARRMLFMVIVATIPLAGAYFLRGVVKAITTDDDIIIEGICFLITGFLIYLAFFKDKVRKEVSKINLFDALIIGLTQLIAVFPGISRSGSTTAVGTLRGLKKETVISFSFILGIPAIIAAAASEFLSTSADNLSIDIPTLATGFLVSLLFGIISIGMIRWLMKRDKYIVFAYYMFLVGIVTISLGICEKIM